MLCATKIACKPAAAVTPRNRAPTRIVCAQAAPSRRDALGAMVAVPALLAAGLADAAATRMELSDDRSAYKTLRRLDQSRNDAEDLRNRFALQDVDKLTLADHKRRATESVARLQRDVQDAVDKKHYYRVQNDIRHQLGTLRFDLDVLTKANGDKSFRQQAVKLQDRAMQALEQLDLYARKRKDDKLDSQLQVAVKALNEAVAFVG